MRRSAVGLVILALILTVAGVAACGGSDSSSTTTPTSGPPATTPPAGDSPAPAAVDGALVYAENCSGCHAGDGSGGQGPDITDETDVQDVAGQVRSGGSGMPPFDSSLTSEQIEAVADYVTIEL